MTEIEWTDQTANPIKVAKKDVDGQWVPDGNHCVPISTGCKWCFASALNARGTRFGGNGRKYGVRPEGHPEMWLNVPMLEKWTRIGKPRKIFVGSMTDWGGEWVEDWMIERIVGAMIASPATFQLLSKRPKRIAKTMDGIYAVHNVKTPPPNIWLGTSAEDQQNLDERLPWLLKTPASVRFLSLEPLLGPINLHGGSGVIGGHICSTCSMVTLYDENGQFCPYCGRSDAKTNHYIGWVIIGGESGPHARELDLDWVRGILAQCKCYGIPAFVKQLGSHWAKRTASWHSNPDRKGGDPAEWPELLRVRMMPGDVWV